jgi:hypothetical protein
MKATSAQVLTRVEEVLQIVLLGGELHDLREHARENGWNLSDGQLRRYQSRALELARERLDKDRGRLMARHLLQRRAMYARAMKAGDWRTALSVAKDEAELLGLYPPKKIAPTTPDGEESYEPVSGLASLIPELQRAVDRHRQGAGGEDPRQSTAVGALAIGPGPADERRGHDARSVAGPTSPLPVDADLAPVLQTGGEEHDDSGAGARDGDVEQ